MIITLLLFFALALQFADQKLPDINDNRMESLQPLDIPANEVHMKRLNQVLETPGLVAFWDFINREDGNQGDGLFQAHTASDDTSRYLLQPRNISRMFWLDGERVTLDDFPLLGRGPFGQAVRLQRPREDNDLPVLMVPRKALHDTPLDIKGPGASVSMVVWMIYQEGAHAIAGMWHEGTDSPPLGVPAEIQVRGQRQYGMFAGLAANPSASSAHISENGLSSFGDTYARHFAVTPETMHRVPLEHSDEELDAGWSAAGFTFDHEKGTLTAYLNGEATDWWIDDPGSNRFFQHTENAWRQAKLAKMPGLQPGEDPDFPRDQFYEPPEDSPLSTEILSETTDERVVLNTYEFTKVRMVQRRNENGRFVDTADFELVELRVNPYWFGHDIYSPPNAEEGGPFTIGRVIHSNRHPTLTAWIGGVSVFDRALTGKEMKNLAKIGRTDPTVITFSDIFDD